MTRPRVIIESRDETGARALADALAVAGMDPLVCSGPDDRDGGCPIFDGAPCALIEGADAVVYDLDLDRADDRLVLKSLVIDHEGLPVVTERSTAEARRHAGSLKHCTVVVPFSPRHTAKAVVGALTAAGRAPSV